MLYLSFKEKNNKLARRRTREGREIEEQKKKKAYVTRKVRRQEGQKARMPVDKKTSLLDGKKQMARKLDGWMARKIEEQIPRRLEDNKTQIQSIEYGLSKKR